MREKIVKIILDALKQVYEDQNVTFQLDISSNIKLFGSEASLDSLGLINLIVAVEQNIEDVFETEITLADERAMSQKDSPFKTIESLTDYIEILLEEKLNG